MATVIVPTRNDVPAFSVRCDLSGVEFLFSFRFNERDSFWYMSVADQLGSAIVDGIKIVIGLPLLRGVVDSRRPSGELIAIDTTSAHEEANDVEALGDRVVLTYAE